MSLNTEALKEDDAGCVAQKWDANSTLDPAALEQFNAEFEKMLNELILPEKAKNGVRVLDMSKKMTLLTVYQEQFTMAEDMKKTGSDYLKIFDWDASIDSIDMEQFNKEIEKMLNGMDLTERAKIRVIEQPFAVKLFLLESYQTQYLMSSLEKTLKVLNCNPKLEPEEMERFNEEFDKMLDELQLAENLKDEIKAKEFFIKVHLLQSHKYKKYQQQNTSNAID